MTINKPDDAPVRERESGSASRGGSSAGSDALSGELPAWHALPVDAVLRSLVSGADGITEDRAGQRLAQHGPNRLAPPPRQGVLVRFLRQFHDILIYVLLAAGAITLALGHVLDASVILGVVFINAVIGFIQEGKAEQALDAIRSMLPLQAQVLRAGQRKTIDADGLVPGDIVFICSGDKVPADLRIVEARSLRIGEAVLTGESVPVEKQVAAVEAGRELGDRTSMAYSGTLVTYGQGSGVVVATGAATEIGRISSMLSQVQDLSTPLLRKLGNFGRMLTFAIIVVSCLMFVGGTVVRGYPPNEMFLAAVGLAVAAIPEGLPAVMTIALAIGVRRMASRNAIIRRLPAAEVLGSVTVICSDKTGTLTKNEMTVQHVLTADEDYEVSGAGYAPDGGFSRNGREVDVNEHPELRELARAGVLCNDASLRFADGRWQLAGDPTEGALVTLAMKAGIGQDLEKSAHPRTDVIPFESEHRFMASLHHDHYGHAHVFLKGAPERVFELCSSQRQRCGDAPLHRDDWMRRMELAAAAGIRLLAVAVRSGRDHVRELAFADIEAGGFTLLAVVGIADPPREEARHAIAACLGAGIRVKMITGDHASTAAAIGRQLGLSPAIRAISGASIDTLDDEALRDVVAKTDIFARASPEHKLRLVKALQAQGNVVAMTGDGVNDAPALKCADVGVAMGCRGTEAAKEAAEIVLADDNFASIVAAVEEGRTAYDNIRKSIIFILPTNGGEAVMVLIAVLLGITLPITPVQILWVNMITAVTLSLAIVFERTEADTMHRPPRDPAEPLLSRFLVWRIMLVSALLVAGSLGHFLWEMERGAGLAVARTAAVNALVMGEIAYLFNCRHVNASSISFEGLVGNRYILLAIAVLAVLQLLFTYLPTMQTLFGTSALDLETWSRIMIFGLFLGLVVELEKWLIRTALARRAEGAHA
ncbi:cation-transporting P-type ATPase [Massilia niastensis]|uniref:cation-transporting P-type ATPase n=1 Tax=Massilia niastensis TaxID=544911 RepID=UPI00036F7D8A|nr:cation-transporting P-type ATPase [Massilia niastensis]